MTNRLASTALLLLPGALVVYLSFNAGGFFPNTTAFVAFVLAVLLALRTLLSRRPFRGSSPMLGIAAGGLALFAGWTLLSAVWSDAPGRALIEFDRVLLYLLALALYGSLARNPDDLRWMLRGLALGFTTVALIALITRVLPDVWPIGPNLVNERLSYPLTYWNALGLVASLGAVLCLHLTSSLREPRLVRVMSAAALPALGATAVLTFSRGGITAGIIGLVVYAVVGRPLGLLTGVIAAAPPTAVAVVAALDADLLATTNPTSEAAVAQGHDVALVVGVCMAGAALARALLLLLDARLLSWRLPRARRPLLASVAVASVTAAVVMVVVLDVPNEVGDQYDRFVTGGSAGTAGNLRSRLTDPADSARREQWRVALDGFQAAPLRGEGAGTYELLWARGRPQPSPVIDGHSLYVEVLGELGVVGLVLLAAPLVLILGTAAMRARRPNRTVHAAVLAAGAAWAFHAGVDWDWEMPALTLWLFAVGGSLLASSARQPPRFRPLRFPLRVGVVAACVGLSVIPALVLMSQGRLDESLDQFEAGNCPAAIDSARDSSSLLGARAEPYEIIGYCELRDGSPTRAMAAMEDAIERDPRNWEYHYGLALAQAVAGEDPRREARTALRLNPVDPSTLDAVERFDTRRQQRWQRRAEVLVDLAFQ